MILLKDCKCILCDNKATPTCTDTWDSHKCEKCNTYYAAINYEISWLQTMIVDKALYQAYKAIYDGKELNFNSTFTESCPNVQLTFNGKYNTMSIQLTEYPILSIPINDDVEKLKNSINKYRKNPQALKILAGFK
jgi:hypothetical protein